MSRLIFFALLSFLGAMWACTDRAGQLPHYGLIPPFKMTDSNGQPFDSRNLAGKVWVADFIYTNCPGPCPRMTSQMHKVEAQVKSDADVKLVSFSVDPDRDTPQVLSAFARRFGGPTKQWFFLTGSPETVHLLAHEAFKIGDVISKMDHSTKFMLVDKHGELRGYYSTFDEDGMPSMLKDLSALRH